LTETNLDRNKVHNYLCSKSILQLKLEVCSFFDLLAYFESYFLRDDGWKRCPRLTAAHVNLDPWAKMKVSYATQVNSHFLKKSWWWAIFYSYL